MGGPEISFGFFSRLKGDGVSFPQFPGSGDSGFERAANHGSHDGLLSPQSSQDSPEMVSIPSTQNLPPRGQVSVIITLFRSIKRPNWSGKCLTCLPFLIMIGDHSNASDRQTN